MPHVAIKAGMTKLKSCTSMPSSPQPPAQAMNVLRSGLESEDIQPKTLVSAVPGSVSAGVV